MHTIVRSPLMTGVALVGAGAIAVSPLVVPPEKVEVAASQFSTAAVQLTANPLAICGEAISQALANAAPLVERLTNLVGPTLSPAFLAFLGEEVLANGTALAGLLNPASLAAYLTAVPGAVQTYVGALQIFIQQAAAVAETQVPQGLEEALGLLMAGNFEGAVNRLLAIPLNIGLFGGILPPIGATGAFLKALFPLPAAQAVIDGVFNNSLPLLLSTGPLLNLPAAFGAGIQDVIDAAGSGDILGVVNALIGVPGTVLDGVLNGGYGPSAPFIGTLPGLLSPLGTIGALLTISQSILTNLGWRPPATMSATASTMAATEVPSEAAASFTLSIADTGAGVEATSASLDATTPPVDTPPVEGAGATTDPEEQSAALDDEEAATEGDEAEADADADAEAEAGADEASSDDDASTGGDDASTGGDDASTDTSTKDGNKVEPGTVANGPSEGGSDGGGSTTEGDASGDGSTDAGDADSGGGSDSGGGEG